MSDITWGSEALAKAEADWEKWLHAPEQEFRANLDRASFIAGHMAAQGFDA